MNEAAGYIVVPPWISRKADTDIAANQQAEEHDNTRLRRAIPRHANVPGANMAISQLATPEAQGQREKKIQCCSQREAAW